MKRLLYMLLALLGFGTTGCGFGAVEYGVPHVHFNLKARVVDEAGKPIEGIEVRAKSNYESDGIPFENRTGVSNYLGQIDAVNGYMHSVEHEVIFIDPDGEANGGKFESKEVDIKKYIVQTDEGDGSWDNGSYVAELGDVEMSLEEATEGENNENNNVEEE